jgi:hypothetical protein
MQPAHIVPRGTDDQRYGMSDDQRRFAGAADAIDRMIPRIIDEDPHKKIVPGVFKALPLSAVKDAFNNILTMTDAKGHHIVNLRDDQMFLGTSKSGKTTVAKYLMAYGFINKQFEKLQIVTETPQDFEEFSEDIVHDGFDEQFLLDLLGKQKGDKKGKKKGWLLVYIDNVAGDNDVHASAFIKKMLYQGRWENSTIWIAQQDFKMISPGPRDNIDLTWIGLVTNRCLGDLYDATDFPGDIKEFKKFIQSSTTDHQFVLYKKTSERQKWFTFKAPFPPPAVKYKSAKKRKEPEPEPEEDPNDSMRSKRLLVFNAQR